MLTNFSLMFACLLVTFSGKAQGSLRCRWEAFKREFGKQYSSHSEEEKSFKIFTENVRELRLKQKNGKESDVWHIKGINKFSDMVATANTKNLPKSLMPPAESDSHEFIKASKTSTRNQEEKTVMESYRNISGVFNDDDRLYGKNEEFCVWLLKNYFAKAWYNHIVIRRRRPRVRRDVWDTRETKDGIPMEWMKGYTQYVDEGNFNFPCKLILQEIFRRGPMLSPTVYLSEWNKKYGKEEQTMMSALEKYVSDTQRLDVCNKSGICAAIEAMRALGRDWTFCFPPIKDQGACQASHVFAAVAALECNSFLYRRVRVPLSEQQIIDCSENGNNGCDGGTPNASFFYTFKNLGIHSEYSYPYVGKAEHCTSSDSKSYAPILDVINIKHARDAELIDMIDLYGPAVAILGTENPDFTHYSKGIYYNSSCGIGDHHVLIVGYGEEDGKPYWKIRNSYGTDWGDRGYMRIARSKYACGIGDDVHFPIIYARPAKDASRGEHYYYIDV